MLPLELLEAHVFLGFRLHQSNLIVWPLSPSLSCVSLIKMLVIGSGPTWQFWDDVILRPFTHLHLQRPFIQIRSRSQLPGELGPPPFHPQRAESSLQKTEMREEFVFRLGAVLSQGWLGRIQKSLWPEEALSRVSTTRLNLFSFCPSSPLSAKKKY